MKEYNPKDYKSIKDREKLLEQEKRVEKPVVSGTAKVKKKGEMQKFADVFISEDVSNVKSYILMDVLVPAVKKAISDIVTNGIDMILYGESGRSKKSGSASKVSYRSYYEREGDRQRDRFPQSRNDFDYDNIVFPHRGDAEAVLTALEDIIAQFDLATVGDLYDLSDVSTSNFNVHKYGWKNIRSAQVVRGRDGYFIKLPKAMPLD